MDVCCMDDDIPGWRRQAADGIEQVVRRMKVMARRGDHRTPLPDEPSRNPASRSRRLTPSALEPAPRPSRRSMKYWTMLQAVVSSRNQTAHAKKSSNGAKSMLFFRENAT